MDAIERLRERAQNEATCIELSRQNKELRARFANWQDDINAVLEQRNDLHARVAMLEEALQKIADGRGMVPDKSTIYMNGSVPEVPKHFNVYDMREIASRALEEK